MGWHVGPGGVQPVAARVTSHAGLRVYQARGVQVTHSIYDAHPTRPSRSPVASASLTLRRPEGPVESRAPHPLTRTESWPPESGLLMGVDVGDGVEFSRQMTGIVTRTSGALTSAEVDVNLDEDMRGLEAARTAAASEAVLVPLPPHPDGDGEYRAVNMASLWLIDKVARGAGHEACALWRPTARLSVPLMGSLIPHIGEVIAASGTVTYNPWRVRSPWGVAMRRFDATWKPSSQVGATLEVVIDLPYRDTSADATDAAMYLNGADGSRFSIIYRHTDDTIRVGWAADGGTTAPVVSVARAGAARVAVRISTTDIEIRRDTDATATTAAHATASSWRCATVRVRATESAIGGFTLDANPSAWSSLTRPATARFRVDPTWFHSWHLSPHTMDMSPADVLSAVADAELASWWVENGVLQWAGAGVLENQTPRPPVTSEVDLIDAQWETGLDTIADRVRVEREEPLIRRSRNAGITVWRGGETGLEDGDVWETFATPPEEEDWIGVDTTITKVGASTSLTDLRYGSILAVETGSKTDYDFSSWDLYTGGVLTKITQRAYKVVVVPAVASGNVANISFPDNLASRTFPRSWEGKDGIILRCTGLVTWAKWERPSVSTGAASASIAEYLHDAGRWVQTDEHAQTIEDYLVTELANGYPGLTVPVRPSPDRRVGDLVPIQDRARTGITVWMLVQSIAATWADGDASQVLSGRIARYEVDGAVRDALAPAPLHWLQNQPHGTTGMGR